MLPPHHCSLFYGYGTFLHWGHESTILDAHNPFINTSYQRGWLVMRAWGFLRV